MGMDDSLVLGLGLLPSGEQPLEKKSSTKRLEPSLTLTLSAGETSPVICNNHQTTDLHGQDSTASSLSNVSVKREREEPEVERVSSRVSDEDDDDGSNGKKKLRLTKPQSALLEESFKHHSTLNPMQKQELARDLKLSPRQVEVWFQNRRARTKLKQTEVNCELLKKYCEKLTEENRRLHKELQEQKFAQQLFMPLPPATLTMCPSCERIGGAAVSKNAAKSSFAKPHLYNSFTNSSAAC